MFYFSFFGVGLLELELNELSKELPNELENENFLSLFLNAPVLYMSYLRVILFLPVLRILYRMSINYSVVL